MKHPCRKDSCRNVPCRNGLQAGCRPRIRLDKDECEGIMFHKCLFTQITISVGITIPNYIGLEVNYKICFGNATCEKGLISVFGNPGIVKKNLKISSEHFRIQEDTVRMKLYKKLNGQC